MAASAAAIEIELRDLAGRVIDRAFTSVGRNGPLPLAGLTELALTHCPAVWRDNRTTALETVLRAAIDRLPHTEALKDSTMPLRAAVCMLYNIDAPDLGVRKIPLDDVVDQKLYGHLRAELVRVAKPAAEDSTIRETFNKIRRRLARILTDPNFDLTPGDGPHTTTDTRPDGHTAGQMLVTPVLTDGFVARPHYETLIRSRRDAGQRLIWLHGDAGTGKSRLARAAHRDLVNDDQVPVLHAGDRGRLEREATALLATAGVPVQTINPTNLWPTVGAFLSSDQAPPVVVLDDLPPDSDILDLLGAPACTILMVTSRNAPPARYNENAVRVGELAPDELRDMLASRLPDVDENARDQLATTLGGRPLAIEHSASFLRETGMSVAEYCTALTTEPGAVLDAAGQQYGQTLTAVYQLTLERLASSFDVLRALDLIVFTAPGIMTPGVLVEAWADGVELPEAVRQAGDVDEEYIRSASLWTAAWPGVTTIEPTRLPRISALAQVRLHAAIRRLDEYGLIRSEGGVLVMHPLTRTILRELRQDQADNIYDRLIRAVYDTVVAERWSGGDALSLSRLWWAPHLRAAVARAGSDVDRLLNAPTDEVIRTATLAAMMIRAYRQAGLPVRDIYREVTPALAAASVRHSHRNAPIPDEQALTKALHDILLEIHEWLVLEKGFDTSIDSFPHPGREPTGAQRWFANSARLRYPTEWQLAHHVANPAERERAARETYTAAQASNSGPRQLRQAAEAAMAVAACAHDAAQWPEAIAALERAYGCYLQVGANVEAIRGAMDAARRLSRTHLRAGHIDDAGAWVVRVLNEVYLPRSESSYNGKPSPFKLRDVLLELQLQQAKVEVELAAALRDWDRPDFDVEPSTIHEFAGARFARTNQALGALLRTDARRLVPEYVMYLFRLLALTGQERDHAPVRQLAEWFERDGLDYQHDLLSLQLATMGVLAVAAWVSVPDEHLDELLAGQPAQVAEVAMQTRGNRQELGDALYDLAHKVGTVHRNRYWHARGLAATVLLGTEAGRADAWITAVRDELEQVATAIQRPDLIESVDGFATTNSGLWLYGY